MVMITGARIGARQQDHTRRARSGVVERAAGGVVERSCVGDACVGVAGAVGYSRAIDNQIIRRARRQIMAEIECHAGGAIEGNAAAVIARACSDIKTLEQYMISTVEAHVARSRKNVLAECQPNNAIRGYARGIISRCARAQLRRSGVKKKKPKNTNKNKKTNNIDDADACIYRLVGIGQ